MRLPEIIGYGFLAWSVMSEVERAQHGVIPDYIKRISRDSTVKGGIALLETMESGTKKGVEHQRPTTLTIDECNAYFAAARTWERLGQPVPKDLEELSARFRPLKNTLGAVLADGKVEEPDYIETKAFLMALIREGSSEADEEFRARRGGKPALW
ncbi:hypothetical protein HY389_01640 [Candidatus Daviesbacteria bacterium]|nr:hypothetical protein [Candidatus Daviesbacteria bacterium]